MASFGYFVVSIDENICNDLVDENDARAVLLLENIKQILSWNEDGDFDMKHVKEIRILFSGEKGRNCKGDTLLSFFIKRGNLGCIDRAHY